MRLAAIRVAICLAVPALVAAKGPVIDNEGHAFLTIHVMGSGSGDKGQHLNVESWSWGTGAHSGGGANGMTLNDTQSGADPAKERQAGIADVKAETDKGQVDAAASGGHSLGASDKVTAGAQTENNVYSGNRWKNVTLRQPAGGPGSLTVRGSLPGCTVGQRYGGMQFAGGGKMYELSDVRVASCPAGAGPGDIGFEYRKVTVKGWNPETKEL